MKICFQSKNFGSDASVLIETITGILQEYEQNGYDLSLRQLYYQLVSRNVVPNTERSYKKVGNLVSDARLAGLIDWDIIKDRGREMVSNPHWESPAEMLMSCADQYRVDHWKNQPNYVEVMVEKQALEGVLLPVCSKWDIPFTANKGYSSSSALYEAGARIGQQVGYGKNVVVIYLGDHDPSGIDMSRDVLDRVRMFARVDDPQSVQVERIALNIEQVKDLNPPENPAKLTDSRAADYIKTFGTSSWELDAIEPTRLAQLVENAVSRFVDQDTWEDSARDQKLGRSFLLTTAKEYRKKHP